MFHTDAPIKSDQHDLFDRSDFVRRFADVLSNVACREKGFVVGLVGAWGSGKTSLVELTIRRLLHIEMAAAVGRPRFSIEKNSLSLKQIEDFSIDFDKVAPTLDGIVDFDTDLNGWLATNRLAEFKNWFGDETIARRVFDYWELFAWVRRNPAIIIVRFSPWMLSHRTELATSLMSELGRTIGDRLGGEIQSDIRDLLVRLSELAPAAASGLDAVGGGGVGRLIAAGGLIAKLAANRLVEGPSLDQLRNKIAKTLAKLQGQKILIVIDDIDRLAPVEIVELLSVVKGLGDLPNLIYLLCYDDEVLSKAIRVALRQDGRSYLEKIVQYSTHVPLPAQDKIYDLFVQSLQKIRDLDDQLIERLSSCWSLVFKHYLLTPRDLVRMFNSIEVTVHFLEEYVDIFDAMVLEVLRQHDPKIYAWVRANIWDLSVGLSNDSFDEVKDLLDGAQSQKGARNALAFMFPVTRKKLGVTIFQSDDGFSRINNRIRNRDYAANYFGADYKLGSWSSRQILDLVVSSTPKLLFGEISLRLMKVSDFRERSRLLAAFLSALEECVGGNAVNVEWVASFLEFIYSLNIVSNTGGFFLGQDSYAGVRSVLKASLQNVAREDYTKFMSELIESVEDISALTDFFRSAAGDLRQEMAPSSDFFGEGTSYLRAKLISRIRDLAQTNDLWKQSDLRDTLWFWHGSTNEESEVIEFTRSGFKNTENIGTLLRLPVSLVLSSDGNYSKVHPSWQKIIDLDALKMIAERLLDSDESSASVKADASRFLEALTASKT